MNSVSLKVGRHVPIAPFWGIRLAAESRPHHFRKEKRPDTTPTSQCELMAENTFHALKHQLGEHLPKALDVVGQKKRGRTLLRPLQRELSAKTAANNTVGCITHGTCINDVINLSNPRSSASHQYWLHGATE